MYFRLIYFKLLFISYLCSRPCYIYADIESFSHFDVLPCRISSRLRGNLDKSLIEKRIIAIGDVHGCIEGLIEVLIESNIIVSSDCVWNPNSNDTLLIQMGDIVDRGNSSIHVWRCLDRLQTTLPNGAEFIRLIGNHDIWWMEGQYHNRNKLTDSPDVLKLITEGMKVAVLNEKIHGSYVRRAHGMPILFSHAGFRPKMIEYVNSDYRKLYGNNRSSPEYLSEYVNRKVKETVNKCGKQPGNNNNQKCKFDDPIFEAGPDRGGIGIGGPFWTDFSVLKNAANDINRPSNMLQVVGHSIAMNTIRTTKYMQTIGIDAGIYLGGRAFLEVNENGKIYAHEKLPSKTAWTTKDLSALLCD